MCFVCAVVTFFSVRLCPGLFWIPCLAGESGGRGFLSTEARYFGLNGSSGKVMGYKLSAKRLHCKTAAGGVDCHWKIQGEVVRSEFDNVKEPKSRVNAERVQKRRFLI